MKTWQWGVVIVGVGGVIWWLWSRRRETPVRTDLERSKKEELVSSGELPDTAPADEVIGSGKAGAIAAGSPAPPPPGWGEGESAMPVGGSGWGAPATEFGSRKPKDMKFIAAPLGGGGDEPAQTELLGSAGPDYPQRWKP